jgi:hypothetical protein
MLLLILRTGTPMIRNGLWLVETHMQDSIKSVRRGVMIFRDGELLGGGKNSYTTGSYVANGANGGVRLPYRPILGNDPWARRIVTIGFSGTYTHDTAQRHGVAPLGKRLTRLEARFRLLKAI